MAIVVGPVEAVFDADADGFKRGVNQARDALGRFTSEADKLSAAFQRLGFGAKFSGQLAGVSANLKAVSAELALTTAGLVGIGVVAAKAASDFEQTGSLLERVFGDGAEGVEEFARVTADELGLSIQETRVGLANLGAQLKNSLGDTAAAESQSRALIKLAADVSAAMNVPFEDTLARIQSGLRGETEAIEKLNIFIGESSLKQEALRQGMSASVEKMTEQEKTALRLSAIFRQTADLTGAAAAEADTYAGQTARLQASIKNLAVEFGQALLPVATDVVHALRAVVDWFRGLSEDSKSLIVHLGGVVAALTATGFTLGQLGGAVANVTSLLSAGGTAAEVFGTKLSTALKGALVAVLAFTVAYEGTSAILDDIGLRSVPQNVSVLGELKGALGEVAAGGKSLVRVWVNAWATIAAVLASALFILSAGFVDLRDEVDTLQEKAQTALDELGEQEELQAQFEQSTKIIRDAAEAADGMTEEIDASGQSMGEAAKAGATLSERVAQAGREQRDAAAAAREHTKALEEQAKAIKDAAAFAVDLEDELAKLSAPGSFGAEIVGLEQGRRKSRAEAMTRGAQAGLGTAVLEDVARAIDDIFLKKLGATLSKVADAEFLAAMDFALATAKGLGLSFSDLMNASPELAARFDALGHHVDGLTGSMEDAEEAFVARPPGNLSEVFAGMAAAVLGTVKFGGSLLPAAGAADVATRVGDALSAAVSGGLDLGAVAGTIGSIGGAALGSVLPVIGTALGAEIGSIVGNLISTAASGLQQVFSVVGELAATSGPLSSIFADLTESGAALFATYALVNVAAFSLLGVLGPLAPVVGGLAALFGALVIITGSLITQTEGFARAQEAIAELSLDLIEPFEQVGQKAAAFVALFAHVLDAMAPILSVLAEVFGEALLRGLFEGMRLTAVAFLALSKVIADLYNVFAAAEDKIDTSGMQDAIDEIKNLDFEQAVAEGTAIENGPMGPWDPRNFPRLPPDLHKFPEHLRDLGDEAGRAAENMAQMNEELRNAASDFKVAAYRFEAQDVAGGDVGAGGDPTTFAGARGAVVQFILQNALIQANDPMDLLEGIENESRRRAIRRRGSNFGRPDYNGRWEG